eukprot:gene21666-24567_t
MSFFTSLRQQVSSASLSSLQRFSHLLGRTLHSIQKGLAWLDGQHPHLAKFSQPVVRLLTRHPKTISISLASVLLAGGGGAFAIVNLGPDIADQPVVTVTTPIEIPQLQAQAAVLDLSQLRLTRTDTTRSADTPESLLRRLGLVDAQAAAFLRSNPLARLALQQAGRSVSAELTGEQLLSELNVRWLKSENDTFFQRMKVQRTAQGLQASLETSPMNTSIRMTGGTV